MSPASLYIRRLTKSGRSMKEIFDSAVLEVIATFVLVKELFDLSLPHC